MFYIRTACHIGFVGLLVPHLVRLLFGSDNVRVIPLSALVGAVGFYHEKGTWLNYDVGGDNAPIRGDPNGLLRNPTFFQSSSGFRPGTDADALPVYIGSHLDTQPEGGRFDGVYGVLAGLFVGLGLLWYQATKTAPAR